MKKIIATIITLAASLVPALATSNSASADFSITLPSYMKIESVLSPVLTANITDRTGNLHAPLCSKFKVITNRAKKQTLYLKAHTVTENGMENAMFEQGGRVYIAFSNLAKPPKAQALANCKIGAMPKDSPGIVAYPVTSVSGVEHKFNHDKYEVTVNNGVSYVTVNIGSNVLKTSFASNDPKGFYQAILSLTEADI